MRFTNVLVLALVALIPALGSADTCPPTATIGGPAALAQPLTKALIARGVQIEPAGLPAGSCPLLDVQVAAAPGGLKVAITDPWGRRAERSLADVLTAATLIETWARMDLLQTTETSSAAAVPAAPVMLTPPLVAPTVAPATSEAAPLVVPTTPAVDAAPAAEAPAAEEVTEAGAEDAAGAEAAATGDAPAELALVPERSRVLIDLAGEMGVSRSRQVWTGSSLTACVRVGITCVGALGRFSFGDGGDHRIDGLGLIAVPLSLGRLTLSPSIGAGLGVHQRDGQGFGRRGRGFDFDDFDDGDSTQLRVEARLGLSFRVRETLHVELGASASTSPRFGGRFLGSAEDTIVRGSVGLLWGTP